MAKNPQKPQNSPLRVVGGHFKGVNLFSPFDPTVHPMGSREKNALFNILRPYFTPETRVLDVFAGTGALGIEALSRGAKEVVFVENNPHISQTILQNLQTLNFIPKNDKLFSSNASNTRLILYSTGQQARIITVDVDRLNKIFAPATFDLILADPPYTAFKPLQVANLVPLLSKNGLLALSHPKISSDGIKKRQKQPISSSCPPFAGLEVVTTRTYAAAQITIYRRI